MSPGTLITTGTFIIDRRVLKSVLFQTYLIISISCTTPLIITPIGAPFRFNVFGCGGSCGGSGGGGTGGSCSCPFIIDGLQWRFSGGTVIYLTITFSTPYISPAFTRVRSHPATGFLQVSLFDDRIVAVDANF